MDDLFAVILTLIIAVAGVFGQIKKKKLIQASSAESQNTPGDFWNLFNDDRVEAYRTDDPYGDKEIFIKEPGPAVNEQNYTFNAKNEGGKITESVAVKPSAGAKRQPIIRGKAQAKQAIIYSEILNRKYF